MKVLIINTLTSGGAANACLRLLYGLNKTEIVAQLLTLKGKELNSFIHNYHSYLSKTGKKIEQYKGNWTEKLQRIQTRFDDNVEILNFPNSAYRIHEHPLVQAADIINLHWTTHMLDYPSFFKNITKPIIWTLHDMQAFSGGNPYEIDFPFQKYQSKLNSNIKTKKKALRNTNLTVVSPSKWLLQKSQESEAFGSYPHHLIPYGLDTSIFKPHDTTAIRQKLGLPSDKKILLFAAAAPLASKRKGFSYLLDALKKLNYENILLCAIGKNQDININNLPIRKVGMIASPSEMAEWYAASDLFVIPSIEDNLPNTVIESIACGTPVTGFSIGGIPDMVIEGKNGFLCADINSEALAKSIQKALNFSWDNQWIRQDAVQRYDESVQAEKYISLFTKLQNNHSV